MVPFNWCQFTILLRAFHWHFPWKGWYKTETHQPKMAHSFNPNSLTSRSRSAPEPLQGVADDKANDGCTARKKSWNRRIKAKPFLSERSFRADPFKWSDMVPLTNGRTYMGNWGEITLLIEAP